jgi:uncharacterized protein involved in tolerance to divalent cations
LTNTNKNAESNLEQLEKTIKKYLLPYNTFLKISDSNENYDKIINQQYTPDQHQYKWIAGEYNCEYVAV